MLFHGCSLPFIVQAHCSLFPERLLLFSQISAKYCPQKSSQDINLIPTLLLIYAITFTKRRVTIGGTGTLQHLKMSSL